MPILLVEDDIIIGNALHDHLVANGWSVDWSLDLQSALAATKRHCHRAVLLDLHLPDGTGMDLLHHLRKQAPTLPIIILSAYDQVSDRLEGLTAGAVDYLIKPFDLGEMLIRLHRATAPKQPRAAA